MNLADICKLTAQLAPRILIHGAEGVGKTTIASKFPAPIFLQTEDGCPSGLEVNSFGLIDNFEDLRSAIGALASEQHHYQTVVIDSLDATEELIWDDACRSQGWSSIESPGYGKGYVIVESWWIDILKGLEFLRRRIRMSVVLLAHSAIETINDPRAASYTSYQLRLHKRARPGAGLVRRDRLPRAGSSRAERGCRLRQEAQPRRWRIATLAALRGTTKLRRQESLRPAGQNAGAEGLQLRGTRPVSAAAAVDGYRWQTQFQTHPTEEMTYVDAVSRNL